MNIDATPEQIEEALSLAKVTNNESVDAWLEESHRMLRGKEFSDRQRDAFYRFTLAPSMSKDPIHRVVMILEGCRTFQGVLGIPLSRRLAASAPRLTCWTDFVGFLPAIIRARRILQNGCPVDNAEAAQIFEILNRPRECPEEYKGDAIHYIDQYLFTMGF